VRLFQY